MKFLHIVNEGLAGGVLRVALEESRHLNKLGHESSVLLLFDVNMPSNFLQRSDRLKVYRLYRNILPQSFQGYFNPALRELFGVIARKTPRFMGKINPDWIISHNLTAAPLAIAMKQELGCRIALYIHNQTNPPSLRNLIGSVAGIKSLSKGQLSSVISFVDVTLTSSKKMRRFVRKTYNLDAYVLPPGCNPCKPEELEKQKQRVVFIPQRLSIGKGVVEIAKVLAREVNIQVIFAGSSHYTTPLVLKKLRKTGRGKYYVIVNVDEHDLLKLYRKSLFTFSIFKEPFGMHIIESASQGTAPIASKETGASELFQHGVHGLFFKDLDEATEYVATLISDEELAIKLGLNAWRICREKYTWANHANLLIKTLEKAE